MSNYPYVFALGIACLLAGRRAPAQVAAIPRGARDVRRCEIASLAALPRDTAAVRCAEWFVARNGYTEAPPADTAELAGESIEFWGGDRPRALAARHNSLAPRAVVLCRDVFGEPGFTVGFAHPGDTVMAYGRAVTMGAAFGHLVVQHRPFRPAAARRSRGCEGLHPIRPTRGGHHA